MVRVDHKRLGTKEVNSELHQGVLHRQQLLVVDWIVLLSGLQLPRLIRDDSFMTFVILLEQRTSDGIIGSVTNDAEGTIIVRQRQDGR
jgi:hypothetical protein